MTTGNPPVFSSDICWIILPGHKHVLKVIVYNLTSKPSFKSFLHLCKTRDMFCVVSWREEMPHLNNVVFFRPGQIWSLRIPDCDKGYPCACSLPIGPNLPHPQHLPDPPTPHDGGLMGLVTGGESNAHRYTPWVFARKLVSCLLDTLATPCSRWWCWSCCWHGHFISFSSCSLVLSPED